jgi:hypothetical protein
MTGFSPKLHFDAQAEAAAAYGHARRLERCLKQPPTVRP